MMKKTHLASGLAVAMAIVRPCTINDLAICLTSATIGSVISDIDVSSSKSRKELNKILAISVTAIVACTLIEVIFHIGILAMLQSQTNVMKALIGVMLFLLICSFGIHTPHRSFMHSITAVVALTGATCLVLSKATLPFMVSMISHIILDLFNKKTVQLLYPLKKPRIAFNLCKANGTANAVIFVIANIIIILEIVMFILEGLR